MSKTERVRRRPRTLPPHELVALRAMVGLPPEGPTRDMVKRWNFEESLPDPVFLAEYDPEHPSGWPVSVRPESEWLTGPDNTVWGRTGGFSAKEGVA